MGIVDCDVQTVDHAGQWAPPVPSLTVSTSFVVEHGHQHTFQYSTSLTAAVLGHVRAAWTLLSTSMRTNMAFQTRRVTTTKLKIKV